METGKRWQLGSGRARAGRGRLGGVVALAVTAGLLAACGGGAGNAGAAPKAANPNPKRSTTAVDIHFCTPKPAANAADPCWKKATATPLGNVMAGHMPSGFSATFQAVWDTKNLYVLEQVKNPKGFSAANANTTTPWTSDAMEVYLSANNGGGSTMGSNDTQIDIPLGSPSSVWVTSGKSAGGVAGYVKKVTGGYDVMMAIPWADIGTSPGIGQVIGIDPAADTYSNGSSQNQSIAFGNPGSSEQNPSIWGQAVLVQ